MKRKPKIDMVQRRLKVKERIRKGRHANNNPKIKRRMYK